MSPALFPALLADAAPPVELIVVGLGCLAVSAIAVVAAVVLGGLWLAKRMRKPDPPPEDVA